MNERAYIDKTHTWGRIWDILALIMFLMIPTAICIYLDVWPEAGKFFSGLAAVALIFYPTAVVEVVTYGPLLGAGGTYLSFVSGNITNLKMPCAMSAMDNANVRATSEEGEIISTIAIAASTIVTTIIIAISVVLFRPILPRISDPDSVLAPAFQQIIPALFGAIGASYFAKHWKISILPIAVLVFILIFAGGLATGVLIPIGVVVSLLGCHVMFKLGMLDD
ncbi:MAG: hypothetical protein LIO46_05960 [Clostridiales bacterium]|nr:hypothetical protein [Clostridiales bacterium]